MVEIEELDLEDNEGGLELEDNPSAADDLSADGVTLQDNCATGDGDDSDEEEEQWEIPFAHQATKPEDALTLEVRLLRQDGERLGLVLDEQNVVVALRPDTPASKCGEIFMGDKVMAVQGMPCVEPRTGEVKRVATLLRELPDAAVYALTLKRALEAAGGGGEGGVSSEVKDHGPLMTPEEQKAHEEREMEARRQLYEALPDDQKKHMAPRNLTETKHFSKGSEPSAAAMKTMKDMWYRQARGELDRRLNAAEMLKDEGNDKFSEGDYQAALDEYEYAIEMFKYEIANLCRNQQEAELGDLGRGLGSDDLPSIQKIRVPCLLNMAACHIKLGQAAASTSGGIGGESRTQLGKALTCCAEVLQAGPPAAQRAKAHFRIGQANFALENYREAWTALVSAQELNPSSREVRSLQQKVSYELKQLKVAERESREGLMSTPLNHKQLFKREKLQYGAKLKMLKRLLPPAGSMAEDQVQRAETLFEAVAAKGWQSLSNEDQLYFSALWSAAQPRLGTGEVRDGRDAGIFPPRDEERIFAKNLPVALMSKPFPDDLGFLTPEQRQRARGLALTIWQRGAEDLDMEERRFCEGIELLTMASRDSKWHKKPLPNNGGAQLILSTARQHLWPFLPPQLTPVEAVMGAQLPSSQLSAYRGWSRRDMSAGEVGIIASNVACWTAAVEAGWEYSLVLEDDAKVDLEGGPLQLISLLPEIVASATQTDKDWQLLALSPVGLEDFYSLCDPTHVPSLFGEACPAWTRKPKRIPNSGWKRIGPTFHAFGWIYRKPLMAHLLRAFEQQSPPLNPVDVWVWEVLATNGLLGKALGTNKPLVSTRSTPGGADSLRQQQ